MKSLFQRYSESSSRTGTKPTSYQVWVPPTNETDTSRFRSGRNLPSDASANLHRGEERQESYTRSLNHAIPQVTDQSHYYARATGVPLDQAQDTSHKPQPVNVYPHGRTSRSSHIPKNTDYINRSVLPHSQDLYWDGPDATQGTHKSSRFPHFQPYSKPAPPTNVPPPEIWIPPLPEVSGSSVPRNQTGRRGEPGPDTLREQQRQEERQRRRRAKETEEYVHKEYKEANDVPYSRREDDRYRSQENYRTTDAIYQPESDIDVKTERIHLKPRGYSSEVDSRAPEIVKEDRDRNKRHRREQERRDADERAREEERNRAKDRERRRERDERWEKEKVRDRRDRERHKESDRDRPRDQERDRSKAQGQERAREVDRYAGKRSENDDTRKSSRDGDSRRRHRSRSRMPVREVFAGRGEEGDSSDSSKQKFVVASSLRQRPGEDGMTLRRPPLEPSPLGTSGMASQSAGRPTGTQPQSQAEAQAAVLQAASNNMPVHLPSKDVRPLRAEAGPAEHMATASGSDMDNPEKKSTLKRQRTRKHSSSRNVFSEVQPGNLPPPDSYSKSKARHVMGLTSSGTSPMESQLQRTRKSSNASQSESSHALRQSPAAGSPILMVPPRIHSDGPGQSNHTGRHETNSGELKAPSTHPGISVPQPQSRTPSLTKLKDSSLPTASIESHHPTPPQPARKDRIIVGNQSRVDSSPAAAIPNQVRPGDTPPVRSEQHQVWHPPTPASMPSHSFEAKLPSTKLQGAHTSSVAPASLSKNDDSIITPPLSSDFPKSVVTPARNGMLALHHTPPTEPSSRTHIDPHGSNTNIPTPSSFSQARTENQPPTELRANKDLVPPVLAPVYSASVPNDVVPHPGGILDIASDMATKSVPLVQRSPSAFKDEPTLSSAHDKAASSIQHPPVTQRSAVAPQQVLSSGPATVLPAANVRHSDTQPATHGFGLPQNSSEKVSTQVASAFQSHETTFPPAPVHTRGPSLDASRPAHSRGHSEQILSAGAETRFNHSSASSALRNRVSKDPRYPDTKTVNPSLGSNQPADPAPRSNQHPSQIATGVSEVRQEAVPVNSSAGTVLPSPPQRINTYQQTFATNARSYPGTQSAQRPAISERLASQALLTETTPPHPEHPTSFERLEREQSRTQSYRPVTEITPPSAISGNPEYRANDPPSGSSLRHPISIRPSDSTGAPDLSVITNVGSNTNEVGHQRQSVHPVHSTYQDVPPLGRPAKYSHTAGGVGLSSASDALPTQNGTRPGLPLQYGHPDARQPATLADYGASVHGSRQLEISVPADSAPYGRRIRKDSAPKPDTTHVDVKLTMWDATGSKPKGEYIQPRSAFIQPTESTGAATFNQPDNKTEGQAEPAQVSHASAFAMRSKIQNPRLLELLSSPASQIPGNRNDLANSDPPGRGFERPPIRQNPSSQAFAEPLLSQSAPKSVVAQAQEPRSQNPQHQVSHAADTQTKGMPISRSQPRGANPANDLTRPATQLPPSAPLASTSRYGQVQPLAPSQFAQASEIQVPPAKGVRAPSSSQNVRYHDAPGSNTGNNSQPAEATSYPSAARYSPGSKAPSSSKASRMPNSEHIAGPSGSHSYLQPSKASQLPAIGRQAAHRDFAPHPTTTPNQRGSRAPDPHGRPSGPSMNGKPYQPLASDPVHQRPGSALGYRASSQVRPQHQQSSSLGSFPASGQPVLPRDASQADERTRLPPQHNIPSYPQVGPSASGSQVPASRPPAANIGDDHQEPRRRESNDSLKTPSSLAPSLLKPTLSRTSQSSQQEPRKKVGFLGFFKSSKPNQSSEGHGEETTPAGRQQISSRAGARSLQDTQAAPTTLSKARPPPKNMAANGHPPSASGAAASKVFSPFRYLTSKRNRTVSAASAEAQDGTAPNTVINSPTVSMHSQAPPPPTRDVHIAVKQWTTESARDKISRPGVVFDVAEDSFEEIRSGPKLARRGTGRRPPETSSRTGAETSSRTPAEPSSNRGDSTHRRRS